MGLQIERNVGRGLAAVVFLLMLAGVVAAGCGRTTLGPGSSSGEAGADADGGGGLGGEGGIGGEGGFGGDGGQGGGGSPPGCELDVDCDDQDFCTTDRCDDGTCVFEGKDADGDTYVDSLCGGTDCNDLNPNAHPGAPEVCDDAADNDCNGVADCNDPACVGIPDCGCTPVPGGEICDNGTDDDCDTTVDCNDADCIGTPVCGCTEDELGACQDGIDNDCDGITDCDDTECASTEACQCQTTPEICDDGIDQDCDLLVDCADPDCMGAAECVCQPPGDPEQCNDNLDNDCDLLVDCADPDCAVAPACEDCMPEDCTNGVDDDCDSMIDCADSACDFHPNCTTMQEICNNDLDDDNDGFTDCDDVDCANNPTCVVEQANCNTAKLIPGSGQYTGDTTGHVNHHMGSCGGGAGEAVFYIVLTEPSFVHLDTIGTSFDSVLYVRRGHCEEGAEIACDDDSGGFQWSAAIDFPILYPGTYYVFVDGFTVDPELGANDGPFTLNVQIDPNPSEVCGDGVDNDGDIYVDCADPDCTNVGMCQNCNGGNPPEPELGITACTDNVDNDCDGLTDCADDDCSASPYAITECCNGMDQNDNGIPDDFSCRCASDADCDGGQICYTHTVNTCGLPCGDFFGMVCPSVADGSFCSMATDQCEF